MPLFSYTSAPDASSTVPRELDFTQDSGKEFYYSNKKKERQASNVKLASYTYPTS